jgi:hypothetical protein
MSGVDIDSPSGCEQEGIAAAAGICPAAGFHELDGVGVTGRNRAFDEVLPGWGCVQHGYWMHVGRGVLGDTQDEHGGVGTRHRG